jgi:hypothetical protein
MPIVITPIKKKKTPMPKPRPKSLKADKTESLDKKFSAGVSATNKKNMQNVKKKKDGGKLSAAKKKVNDPDYNVMSGRKGNVNQKKAESMGKKGRRAGPIEKGVMGAGLALLTRGKAGTGAALTGAKALGKRIFKTAKDVGSVTIGKSKTQPKKGGEYRVVKPTPPKKRQTISGISKRSTQTGKGIRSTPKPIVSALGVAGSKKKDKTPTPKPRPFAVKPTAPKFKGVDRPKKGMFMKEGSGISGKDMRKAKDSNVKFKSEVIKRKKK